MLFQITYRKNTFKHLPEQLKNLKNLPAQNPPAPALDKKTTPSKSPAKSSSTDLFSAPPNYFKSLEDAQAFLITRGFKKEDFKNMPDISPQLQTVLSLLTPQYLGPELYDFFSKFPAQCVCAEPRADDRVYPSQIPRWQAGHVVSYTNGDYFPTTNLITIDAYDLSKLDFQNVIPSSVDGADFRISNLCHEMHHYLSDLQKNRPNLKKWLDEGLTEFLSVRLQLSNGLAHLYSSATAEVSYPAEVTVADLLAQVAGEDALRRAYLGGEWGGLSNALDSALGKGSFSRLLACKGPAEAQAFLLKKCKAAKKAYVLWDAQARTLGQYSKRGEMTYGRP
ncbi:Uncharacterised protein [uncultured archaeon]|nr:Uncharacterised protein [uncultured archaeon]